MLKIQRKSNGRVLFTLSGRIDGEDLEELRRLLELEAAGSSIALDLKDVTLVDRDAVKFLTDCEAGGIKLENCPPYVREWIGRESGLTRRKKTMNARTNKLQTREHDNGPK
jgi:predicted metal-binding protein